MKVKHKQALSRDCLICGVDNGLGLHAHFYEMEDGKMISTFTFKEEHQSYPGRVHGGMIAAVIDETIGRLLWIEDPNGYAVTMKLNIEDHKPVPYGEPLKCVASLKRMSKMTFEGEAEIKDEKGTMLAKGNALYFRLAVDKITGEEGTDVSAFNIDVPDDVKDIEE